MNLPFHKDDGAEEVNTFNTIQTDIETITTTILSDLIISANTRQFDLVSAGSDTISTIPGNFVLGGTPDFVPTGEDAVDFTGSVNATDVLTITNIDGAVFTNVVQSVNATAIVFTSVFGDRRPFLIAAEGIIVDGTSTTTTTTAPNTSNDILSDDGTTKLDLLSGGRLFRPFEGDLIFFPLSKQIYEIRNVAKDKNFYPRGTLPTFSLDLELFEYGNENIDAVATFCRY